MPVTRIPLPEDPGQRRIFLIGMTSAHRDWDEKDVALARPVLSPQVDIFDAGRALGLDMVKKNRVRRKNLQQGITGRVWRILFGKAEAKKRKDAIPELP